MTLDEFITLFQNRKLAVHVNNQTEKTTVLSFVRTSILTHSSYDLPFDSDFQYVGLNNARDDVNCWGNPARRGADSIEYEEFCSIVYEQEDLVDEKSILSLL